MAELIAYMKDTHIESDAAPVFKLAKLGRLYKTRLKLFGCDVSGRFNNTHLKPRILAHQQDLQVYREGRDVLLAFSKDVVAALRQAYERDFDDEAWILSQAAKIVRRDMVSKESKFQKSLENNCQQESTTQSLRSLVAMILGGSNIQTQTNNLFEIQAVFSVFQCIFYNSTFRHHKQATGTYHNTMREPPLSIYVGLLLHGGTRKRSLIDKFYDLGLSVSYDTVFSISADLGNDVSALYKSEGVVCPRQLRH